ncbi:unnamed protein product [Discula destructiva]
MHFTHSFVAFAAIVGTVSAHTRVFSAWVNDVDQGDGRTTYIRSPPSNSPVKDLTSSDLVCNAAGGTAMPGFVKAAAGDTVALEWYHDSRGDDIIDATHKGPIMTYIAPYFPDNGAAAIWTKIDEEGYDGASWAVDNLIANRGKKSFQIPSNIKAGQYMIRQEIIGLHEADTTFVENSGRGAQFYPSCVQFDISGDGTSLPSDNFNFNGGYTDQDPGILFSLYVGDLNAYQTPGPAVNTQLTGVAQKRKMRFGRRS